MRKTLRKFWIIFSLHWQEALLYRAELLVWRIVEVIPLLAMLALWFGVYSQGNQVGQFTLNMLITYYIIGHIIRSSVSVHFEESGVTQVNDGTIARFFIRPFSYRKHILIDTISWRVFNLTVFTIPLLVLVFILLNEVLVTASFEKIFLIIIFLLAAWGIEVLTSLAIVAFAFYFEQARSLTHLKWILNGVLGGSLLPLSLYPEWFEKITRLLPFQYKFAVPMEIYLGQKNETQIVTALVGALAWVLVLYLLVNKFWNRAVKKFTAVGN